MIYYMYIYIPYIHIHCTYPDTTIQQEPGFHPTEKVPLRSWQLSGDLKRGVALFILGRKRPVPSGFEGLHQWLLP